MVESTRGIRLHTPRSSADQGTYAFEKSTQPSSRSGFRRIYLVDGTLRRKTSYYFLNARILNLGIPRRADVMFCTKCGKNIGSDAVFCQYCGIRQTGAPIYTTTVKPRLVRSRYDKKIAGVCAGVARYLDLDANLVR